MEKDIINLNTTKNSMTAQVWRKAKYLCLKDKVLFWGTFEESLECPVKANICPLGDVLYVKVIQ